MKEAMLVICPYPECRYIYEIPGEDDLLLAGECQSCGRPGTRRSEAAWEKLRLIQQSKISSVPIIESPGINFGLTAVVEDVRSLWNVGSMFRTADAAGVDKLYLCGITGAPPRNEIAKTSLGAENHVFWQYFPHALDIIPELKAKGVQILGLEKNNSSQSLTDVLNSGQISRPVCFVVGNEVRGLSIEVMAYCDLICHLPMQGYKESLNVSVAFGIAAYFLNTFI
jgi:23S rRNA (guanosine2251-2'-O)-methyltransferase